MLSVEGEADSITLGQRLPQGVVVAVLHGTLRVYWSQTRLQVFSFRDRLDVEVYSCQLPHSSVIVRASSVRMRVAGLSQCALFTNISGDAQSRRVDKACDSTKATLAPRGLKDSVQAYAGRGVFNERRRPIERSLISEAVVMLCARTRMLFCVSLGVFSRLVCRINPPPFGS